MPMMLPQSPCPAAAASTSSAQSKLTQIDILDGIRGLAALMVMLFHGWESGAFQGFPLLDKLSKPAIVGQTGVDLFFVLSGFLITRILIHTRESAGYFRNFYLRRALRIFPLYYLFLCLFYFVLPQRPDAANPHSSWWFWCYLQNLPGTFTGVPAPGPIHFWSLAVEEHFYLVWPFLVFVTPLRKLFWVSIALIGSAIACRWMFVTHFRFDTYVFTLCRMDALAFGTLLACMETSGILQQSRRFFLGLFLVLVPVLALLWGKFSGSHVVLLQIVKYSLIACAYFALLGLAVCYQNSPWARLSVGCRALRFSGKISYGLYVYHPACYLFAFQWIPAPQLGLLAMLTGAVLTYLVSAASFYLYESQFLKLKSWFEYGTKRALWGGKSPI